MAVIGKIRQRAGLAIAVVGVSLLAFILGDLLTSNRSFFGSETNLAVIGGKKISVQDFEARIQKLEFIFRLNNESRTLDQAAITQLREQAWSQLLNDELMVRQMDKAGVVVSEEELFDMVQGQNIHSQIKEAFTDPQTGQFNAANVVQFLKGMDNDASGKTRAQWVSFENGIRDERANQKFNSLISKGIYATTEEAKQLYTNNNTKAVLKYVQLPFSDIADSAVKPTDARLSEYYNEHKHEYKQEASRHIEYVVFEVTPTDEDRAKAADYIGGLLAPYTNTTDDSAFVALNADTKPDYKYQKKGTLAPRLDSVIFEAPIGTVIGPYEENGFYKLAKLTGKREVPDSIKVSHALVAYAGAERAPQGVTRTLDEARAMADSLFERCKDNADEYLNIARNASDDAVSAQKDGDLGWLNSDSPMDPRFLAGAFSISKGEVKVVESNFGFHLIKVFDAGPMSEQVQVMIVDRIVEPGTRTFQNFFSKANEFAGMNNTAEKFDQACLDQGLNKRVLESMDEKDQTVPGLESAREVVRWAFSSKKGEISKAFELDEKFVVAKLVDVKEKGISTLEQVKQQVTDAVTRELKAEILIKKLEEAGGPDASLDAIASKTGKQVQVVDNVSLSTPYLANLGMEPQVVGWAFALETGQISKPFMGEGGVFIIQLESVTKAQEKTDFAQDRKTKLNMYSSRASYELFNALKDKAEIVDNRGKFY